MLMMMMMKKNSKSSFCDKLIIIINLWSNLWQEKYTCSW